MSHSIPSPDTQPVPPVGETPRPTGLGEPASASPETMASDATSPDEEWREAVPARFSESFVVGALSRALQVTCLVYAGVLVYWVWLAKDVAASRLFADPVFYGYSIAITAYIGARFFLAPFYRPTPDRGFRPTVSIVVPAFNEEDCIGRTIDACYTSDYPQDHVSVVVVDDGSSDGTWDQILAARERHPSLVAVQFTKNRGKREAMAEGIRRSSGQVCVFIDSDSVIDADGLSLIVQDLSDPRVGAVVGTAEVLNKRDNLLTKMQQVRYFVAFRVVKGS
ncbi:MAG: glycosyltransferase family 2 protein, partial [Gaiellaceae bacterium]